MADEDRLNGEPAVSGGVDPEVELVDASSAAVPATEELSVVERARASRPVRITEPKGKETPKRDEVVKAKSQAVKQEKRTTPVAFVKQAFAEIKKVIWPTGDQLSQSFVVVLTFVLFVMTVVVLLDALFGWVLIKLLG